MSDLLDRGSLFISSLAALAISFALSRITVVFPFPFYGPLFGLAVIYVPVCNAIFNTAPLTVGELAISIGMSSIVFVALELSKVFRRRRALRSG